MGYGPPAAPQRRETVEEAEGEEDEESDRGALHGVSQGEANESLLHRA